MCFLITLPCWAQTSVSESALGTGILDLELSASEITVGDRVEARLTLVWAGPEPDGAPRFPTWQTSWGDAEILSTGDVEALADPNGRRVFHQDLVLTAFTTGAIPLPEVTVAVTVNGATLEVASGEEWGFNVRSVLPEDGADVEPRPPAPPRPLAANARFVWTIAGLGACGLLAAWLLGRRLKVSQATAATTPAEPLQELLDHLMKLDPTATEPAHTGLSLNLRHFLARSLGFPATESTTREIERRLRRTRVTSELVGSTVQLLRDCDQVKFARATVSANVTRRRLRQARDLGYRIDRGLRPPPDSSAEATGKPAGANR